MGYGLINQCPIEQTMAAIDLNDAINDYVDNASHKDLLEIGQKLFGEADPYVVNLRAYLEENPQESA